MRFALLGDHPDGLAMARALVETGRHELATYAGSPVGVEYLRRWNLTPQRHVDLEENLADPTIAAVIVAGSPGNRPALLRRALQSERHVLCVHPPDQRPDIAYEAAMIQAETRVLLFPLLPETLHPAVRRLAETRGARSAERDEWKVEKGEWRVKKKEWSAKELQPSTLHPPLSTLHPSLPPLLETRLVEVERWSTEQVLVDAEEAGHSPGFPGWDVLRFLGGEIAEVSALAGREEVVPNEPILLTGRFEAGGMFQVSLLPRQAADRWRLAVVTAHGRAELVFAEGWPGPARLTYLDATGSAQTETYPAWNPWAALVEAFEEALALSRKTASVFPPGKETAVTARPLADGGQAFMPPGRQECLPQPTWQDAIRCLELDDAARRSVARRRASTLEYQEATEEASFKGTMTLAGCSLLWLSLVLLILSVWIPWLGWLIAPVFAVFLALQFLRWVVPPGPGKKTAPEQRVESV